MRRVVISDRAGSVAVEFALVGPLMILLIIGMVVYGGWFGLAQTVQGLAAEGARAAVGGLDDAERRRLASTFVASAATEGGLRADRMAVTVQSDAQAIRVRVAYDAHDHPILALSGLIPSPPATIVRSAAVRTGGY